MLGFFRRNRSAAAIERLLEALMAQARQPAFYAALAVPDSVDGRFEMVALHAGLIVRRLERAAAPGPDMARDLTDAVFSRFEVALREMGVGDLTVPKRMKKMAESYLGRTQAYGAALEARDACVLAQALARNIYGEDDLANAPFAGPMADYVLASADILAKLDDARLIEARLEWPAIPAGAGQPG
ncbi:MAG: ubiquinol-cytochrome C chaperone family protein [Beijerinckiaceae bacterium]